MNWPALLGTSWSVTLAVTIIFMGGCAIITGRALADSWRPAWLVVPYVLLLGLANRFLIFALFDGALLSLSGFVVHTAILLAMALASYRATRARRMVTQYPWLFVRAGPFGWCRRP